MKREVHHFNPHPPYDFEATAGYATYNLGRYAADSFERGVFSRALEFGGQPVLVKIAEDSSSATPLLTIEVVGDGASDEHVRRAVETASRLVGAHVDLEPFYDASRDDDIAGFLVERFPGLGVPQTASPFEAVVLAILGQQISGHVARVLRELIVETFGMAFEVDGVRYATFPSPEAIAAAGPEALRQIKFSARKSEYIHDISSSVASGELDLDALAALPSEEIVDELIKLRGVGPWTAHWLLIRAYGHPDGFPHGDLAVQRALGTLSGVGRRLSADEALELSARWSPFRTYLSPHGDLAVQCGQDARAPSGPVRPESSRRTKRHHQGNRILRIEYSQEVVGIPSGGFAFGFDSDLER